MRRAALSGLLLVASLGGIALAQAPKAAPLASAPESPTPTTLADLHPGEGWQEVAVKTEGALIARAWNDSAAGCNLASFRMPIPATAQIDPLAESFGKALGSKALSQWEIARDGESLRLQLKGEQIQGIASLRLYRQSPTVGDSSASLLACYWNEREPERCANFCERVLDSPNPESP